MKEGSRTLPDLMKVFTAGTVDNKWPLSALTHCTLTKSTPDKPSLSAKMSSVDPSVVGLADCLNLPPCL